MKVLFSVPTTHFNVSSGFRDVIVHVPAVRGGDGKGRNGIYTIK